MKKLEQKKRVSGQLTLGDENHIKIFEPSNETREEKQFAFLTKESI